MSVIRDQQQARLPAAPPLRPRLATTQSTSPRRSPALRIAAPDQTLNSSINPPSPTRRPFVAHSTPASGRSTPRSFAASPTPPQSPGRISQKPGSARNTPNSGVTKNIAAVRSPLSQTTVSRPLLARGVTTTSATNFSPRPLVGRPGPNLARSPATRAPVSVAGSTQSSPVTPKPQRPTTLAKTPSFFHADEIPARSPSPDVTHGSHVSKFIYATGVEDDGVAHSFTVDPSQAKALTQNTRLMEQPSSKLNLVTNAHSTPERATPRELTDSTSIEDGSQLSQLLSTQAEVSSQPEKTRDSTISLSSAQPPSKTIHKSPSVVSVSRFPLNPQRNSLSSAVSTVASVPSATALASPSTIPLEFQSPRPKLLSTTSTRSVATVPSETAVTIESDGTNSTQEAPNPTSARHERKLLDLEISNASLLALNRSLERELAKQKTELRRLRRLTRDRSSWLSDTTSNADEGFSDLGSRLSGANEADDAGADGLDGIEESPGLKRARRTRDSASGSTYIDLARHKQILAESQRMNTALQRCVGITDALIRDGDEALAHKVDPHEPHGSQRSSGERFGDLLNFDGAEADAEEAEEYERFRSVQEEMYARQAEVDALVRAWQGLTFGASLPARGLPRGRKEREGEKEKYVDLEDKDSGVDLNYSSRSSGIVGGGGGLGWPGLGITTTTTTSGHDTVSSPVEPSAMTTLEELEAEMF